MGLSVTIVVATYGDREWLDLAHDRATRSAMAQGVPVIYVHGLTLHGARNAGLAQVQTEHVIFLDGDDELAPDYIAQMAAGSADIRAPAVSYIRPSGRPRPPRMLQVAGHTHDCHGGCLPDGNWIVLGACVRTAVVRAAGGFEAFEWSEDWALWSRCWKAGATIERVPAAVYIAHMRPDSRNRAPQIDFKTSVHHQIHRAVWPELHEAAA